MQNDPLSLWENSHLLGINNVKWHSLTLRDLLFAENQQCKVTLSQSDQSAHCWKQCTSHSLTSNSRKYEREKRTSRRINNANSFSLPNERERDKLNQKKSLRLTGGQWPLFCNISPDYHLSVITNHCTLFPMIGQWPWHCAILGQWTWHCAILSLTNQITWCLHHWATPPKLTNQVFCYVTTKAYINPQLRPVGSSVSEFLLWFALPWACQPLK